MKFQDLKVGNYYVMHKGLFNYLFLITEVKNYIIYSTLWNLDTKTVQENYEITHGNLILNWSYLISDEKAKTTKLENL